MQTAAHRFNSLKNSSYFDWLSFAEKQLIDDAIQYLLQYKIHRRIQVEFRTLLAFVLFYIAAKNIQL